MKLPITATLFATTILLGCASTYGNLTSGSGLGAQEYTPAVVVNQGMEGKYSQILAICRSAAVNRQITAAQEGQLKTITGAVAGAGTGAATGLELGFMLKQVGLGTGVNRSMGIGMAGGLISSLATSFASGTNNDASETKRTLLQCLKRVDPQESIYKVVE